MYYYINTFYIYSLFGYIYELLLGIITKGKIINNLLFEPIKPIYGIGTLFVLFLEKKILKNKDIKKEYKILIFIVTVFVSLTLFEYLTGVTCHKFLGKNLWNYKHKHFHIGKYICLEVSILWTVLSVIYTYYLKERINKIIKKIPVWFSNTMIIITITDILVSLIIK